MTDNILEHFLDLPEAQPTSNGNTPHTAGETYIWITRWEDFQHYRPERDKTPAWIKDYTKQDNDDDYRALTFALRGVLSSLRREFAASHGKLRGDPATLTRRTGQRVRREHIEALNHAGFIELLSRPTLDTRLDLLYSSPRARVEVEVEVEKEPLNPRRRGDFKPSAKRAKSTVCPDCELGGGHHLADCPQVQAAPAALELPTGGVPA